MRPSPLPRAVLAAVLTLASGCTSGDAPSASTGACTQAGGVWTCGGYGELPQCPAGPGTAAACTYDGGACFECARGAGQACGCGRGDAAGASVWICSSLGASCQP